MERTILVNLDDQETKVAILEDGEVVEIFIDRDQETKLVGNIYIGLVEKVMKNLEAVFVNIGLDKSCYLPFMEIYDVDQQGIPRMKKGDRILVQVIKDPISMKGARCTTNISLPGRYLVYKPFDSKPSVGVSRSIVDVKERDRVRSIIKNIKVEEGSFIIRTEASGADEKFLLREVEYLTDLWKKIDAKIKPSTKSLSLIHKDFGIVFKIVRDKMTQETKAVIIDSLDEYQAVASFVKMLSPESLEKVIRYTSKTPLFESYGVDKVLNRITKQRIYLKSGGYIIIQEAESLCAIDVNTGRTKGKSLEETILKSNLEAVEEIALQLRLRNIGGIIVIDFVDMYKKEHKDLLLQELRKATKYDKARIKILPVTALGLVEMTRQRKTESVLSFLSDECPLCHGVGRINSKETVYFKIRRELKNMGERLNGKKVSLGLNPYFKDFFNSKQLKKLEQGLDINIHLEFLDKIHINDYEISVD
jgi:ribonuclease G